MVDFSTDDDGEGEDIIIISDASPPECIALLGDHDENDLLLNIGSAKIFDVMKNEVNQ